MRGIEQRGAGAINTQLLAPLSAGDFFSARPPHLLGGRVEKHHLSELVRYQNAIAHIVQNRPKYFRLTAVSCLRTRQRFLLLGHNLRRFLALGDFLGVGGGLQHRYFEGGRLPRLGDIRMDLPLVDGANQGVDVHIARDKNPRGVADLARFRQKLAAGQLGHPLVGQNYRDLRVPQKLPRCGGVGADHHFEIVFQQIVDRFQNLRLIVHHEHSWFTHLRRHAVAPSELGIFKINSVHSPVLENSMEPSCACMIPYEMARPRPVPCPTGLVVKNGSKILFLISSGIPFPVSRMRITKWPFCWPVAKVMRPGPSIASMALAMTFMSTWFSSPAKQVSISTSPYWRSTWIRSSILWPKNRRTDSMLSWTLMVLMVPSSSLEKVRSLATSSFTRVAPAYAPPMRACILPTFSDASGGSCAPAASFSSDSCTIKMLLSTNAMGLLISCAIPATNWPSP